MKYWSGKEMKVVHLKVKSLTDKKKGITTDSGYIKDKDGKILFERDCLKAKRNGQNI